MCPYFSAVGFSYIVIWALSMQCSYSSYVYPSATLLFLAVVVKHCRDCFWKPMNLFSIFFKKNYLLMFYAVYRSSCFWNDLYGNFNWTACWWPCCYLKGASSLRTQERTWVFWEAFKFLRWCSTFVQNKTKEIGYTSPAFHCLIVETYWI